MFELLLLQDTVCIFETPFDGEKIKQSFDFTLLCYLEQDRSGLVGQSLPFKSILSNPIQPRNENGPAPIAALLSIVENLA